MNYWASLAAQTIKRLPAMQETLLRFLGREDLLEKEMVTHSSILAWKIPWTEEPGRLQSMVWQRVSWTQLSEFTFFLSFLSKLSLARKSPQGKSHYAGDLECMDMVGTERTWAGH